MFSIGKNWILNTLGVLCITQNFDIKKDHEYLYRLFGVWPKQVTCEMRAIQGQNYIQQYFHDEQGAKFMQNLTFLIWLEMTMGMCLSIGGWPYL